MACGLGRLTYLVELKELLFEPIPLGLLAVSSEPLHPVSAPAWSLQAHRYTLEKERQRETRQSLRIRNQKKCIWN